MIDMIAIVEETIAEFAKDVAEVLDDILKPLVDAKRKKEHEIFNKEYDEMIKMEEEAG